MFSTFVVSLCEQTDMLLQHNTRLVIYSALPEQTEILAAGSFEIKTRQWAPLWAIVSRYLYDDST